MKKVMVAYVSRTGNTEKMAQLIAEGIRFTGNQADLKKVNDIQDAKEMAEPDVVGVVCPTYHRDMTAGMKTFLFIAEKANLWGKIGGAFGSYTHSGESGTMVFDTMLHVFKMDMVDLGPLILKEAVIPTQEGAKACQDYGKAIGNKFSK
ncbi:MAG: flavodoxin domain-containing protein [Desulfobacteraceae bacterium]|nr:flavodoxin domain-containing protein [Desulfobacteraceae bacterium]